MEGFCLSQILDLQEIKLNIINTHSSVHNIVSNDVSLSRLNFDKVTVILLCMKKIMIHFPMKL